MKKKQKYTQIYFDEADPYMEIDTHNTNLKHRLIAFAERYYHRLLCRRCTKAKMDQNRFDC